MFFSYVFLLAKKYGSLDLLSQQSHDSHTELLEFIIFP